MLSAMSISVALIISIKDVLYNIDIIFIDLKNNSVLMKTRTM